MEGFKERLIKEAVDLREKWIKLGDFISDSEIYSNLSEKQQSLMWKQYWIIDCYVDVLEDRMEECFTDEEYEFYCDEVVKLNDKYPMNNHVIEKVKNE